MTRDPRDPSGPVPGPVPGAASDDPRALWQTQPAAGEPISLEAVHRKAHAAERVARRQRVVLYASGAGNIGLCGLLMWNVPELAAGLGYLMATAFFVMYQFRRRMRRGLDGSLPLLAFYRVTLERQRDFARDNWWFVLPVGLNPFVLMLTFVMSTRFKGTMPEIALGLAMLATNVGLLALVRHRGRREAMRIDRELALLQILQAS